VSEVSVGGSGVGVGVAVWSGVGVIGGGEIGCTPTAAVLAARERHVSSPDKTARRPRKRKSSIKKTDFTHLNSPQPLKSTAFPDPR